MMWAETNTDDEESRIRLKKRRDFWKNKLSQEEQIARASGTYFNFVIDIWEPDDIDSNIEKQWGTAIRRTAKQGQKLYGVAVAGAATDHPISQSDSSSVTNTKQKAKMRFDLFQNCVSDRAHLGFSDSKLCHKAYGYLAQYATGIQLNSASMRLQLLNGVKPVSASTRKTASGLKHHKLNKMYLKGQSEYYDHETPTLILIPIYELEEVLGWNGTDGYSVMAITKNGPLGEVCGEAILKYADDECDKNDAEKATRLLMSFYKALVSSVHFDDVKESFSNEEIDHKTTPMTNVKKWSMLVDEYKKKNKKIKLIHLKENLDWTQIKVAKAKVSLDTSLPDPYSMAIKAAINFSAMVGAKVMPGCPNSDWDDSSSDGEMNTNQNDETDCFEATSRDDFESLLRSFGYPKAEITQTNLNSTTAN